MGILNLSIIHPTGFTGPSDKPIQPIHLSLVGPSRMAGTEMTMVSAPQTIASAFSNASIADAISGGGAADLSDSLANVPLPSIAVPLYHYALLGGFLRWRAFGED
ncbi:hypothetical protein FE257_004290 [Aspergillus nanangensis]|uniref:Uncharacterized protein n=1 Tax=Aspergillus nanangensis TaxID=2582783 RepID=A0AAD4GV84_ASPNN|nr:hypothetical protein FE257_004290 [Aspergillus nanangensis]